MQKILHYSSCQKRKILGSRKTVWPVFILNICGISQIALSQFWKKYFQTYFLLCDCQYTITILTYFARQTCQIFTLKKITTFGINFRFYLRSQEGKQKGLACQIIESVTRRFLCQKQKLNNILTRNCNDDKDTIVFKLFDLEHNNLLFSICKQAIHKEIFFME